MSRLVITLIILALFSCKSSESVPTDDEVSMVIKSHLGAEYERVDQANFSLCYTRPTPIGTQWKTILVIDRKSLELLYGPKRLNAIAKWSGEGTISLQEILGVIKDKQSSDLSIRYVDLTQKQH